MTTFIKLRIITGNVLINTVYIVVLISTLHSSSSIISGNVLTITVNYDSCHTLASVGSITIQHTLEIRLCISVVPKGWYHGALPPLISIL